MSNRQMLLDIIEESVSETERSRGVDHGGRGSPWKFWRRFSLRKSKRRHGHKQSNGDSTATWSCGQSSNLPDLVERTGCLRRTQSVKPPPKPPRLFLFRSTSISSPRASMIETSENTSVPATPVVANGNGTCQVSTDSFIPSPITQELLKDVLSADMFSKEMEIKFNGYLSDTKESSDHVQDGLDTNSNVEKPIMRLSPDRTVESLTPSPQYKIVTPELDSRKVRRERSRSRSGDKRTNKDAPHRVIIQSAMELICQRLRPEDVLDTLYSADVINAGDLQAFSGHPDRRLICERLASTVTRGDYCNFLMFCDVLRRTDGYSELSVILDAMVGISDLIYNIPEEIFVENGIEEVSEDEKSVMFDVGMFDKSAQTLRGLVELDRSRSDTRRSVRECSSLGLQHRYKPPRWSSHSFSGGSSEDCGQTQSGVAVISIYISGHSLRGARAKALASVLDRFQCVYELHIGKTQLSGSEMEHLSLSLQNNHSIVALDVRLNTIGDEGAATIGVMLRKTSNIQRLNLSSSGIEAAGCQHLCDGLMINASVKEIDLSFVDIGDEGCVHLAEMLTKNCSISRLRLRNDSISWVGCGLLLDSLQQNETLTELDLSRNFIGDKGLLIVAQSIYKSRSLYELNLENCGITSNGCQGLSEHLPIDSVLGQLDLSVNFIGDVGITYLCNVIKCNKTLQMLALNMCGITNEGLVAILDAMEGNNSITTLKLCYNRFGRENSAIPIDLEDIRFKMHCLTSSKPRLKILLWGNSLEETSTS